MNNNMLRKVYLPLCEKKNWFLIVILAVILNGGMFIIKIVMDKFLDKIVLPDGLFSKIQLGVLIFSILLVIPMIIKSILREMNRIKKINFMKNSVKTQGQVVCVEKVINNNHSSQNEINLYNMYCEEEKIKYGFSGARLGNKARYRIKVKYFNNYKNSYDVVCSDWYDDYKCFACNIHKFDKFFFLNDKILNEHYRSNMELVDVFYSQNEAVVGDFYKK